MTREEAKELLPLIKAFAEGKTIEELDPHGNWKEVENPLFTDSLIHSCIEYRLKPEPKYRPFKNIEECLKEMHRHPDFGWIKGNITGEYTQIIRIYDYETELIFKISYSSLVDYSPGAMFSSYTFTDGTPFGINEE